MADAYSHALVVELGENDVKRVQNRSVKYFQSKSSDGGECEVDYKDGSGTAVVRFREKEDQQSVLAKKDHQFRDEDMANALKLTVSLPPAERKQGAPPEKKFKKSDEDERNTQPPVEEPKPAAGVQTGEKGEDDESEEEELCSTQAVIEKIPASVNHEYLELLVENVFKNSDSSSASQSFTFDILPAISSAVVTFKSEKEKNDFVTGCLHNRNLTTEGIGVRPLELTRKVLVDDLKKISEDALRLYFENQGDNVEDFVLNEQEQSAIITFSNPKAVQKVLMKKHLIKKEEIRVFPFYESLGVALYGEDAPSLKLPAALSEPIEEAVWRYLNDRQTALNIVQNQLTKHFCKVTLGQSALCLNPFPSLLQEQDAKAIVKEWRDDVRSALVLALSNIKSVKFQPGPQVWKESEMKIREVLRNEDVAVVPDEASGILSVVGPLAVINKLQPNLTEVIDNIKKRVHREKFSETHDIRMSQVIFHVLCEDGLRDKLLYVYPELKMTFRKGSTDLSITGLKDEILGANQVICDAMLALRRQHLELDNSILDLLKDEQPEKLTDAFLRPSGINAAFEISANRIQLLAVSDRDLIQAGIYLKKQLVSRKIYVEDRKVLYKPEWQDLVSQLENDYNEPLRRIGIHVAGQKLVVAGLTDVVEDISSIVEDFLAQNCQVEETVNVKPNAKVEYMNKLDPSWLKKMEDKVVVHYKKEALSLSGYRVNVTECKKLVEDVVSSLVFERLQVPKPGVRTFFREKEDMYVSSLWVDTGCQVQLVDESSDDGQAGIPFPVPVYQLKTSDGVEIAVCKANMCTYPVDAVINAFNPDLKYNSGFSAVLVKVAGPQLQVECNQQIRLNGQFRSGDCVMTGTRGWLSCKKIIHAVLPMFDPAKIPKTRAALRKAVKGSLELAERRGCVTVALLAIGRNLGFPLDLCATIIVGAVKEYCDEKADNNTLKKIHLVYMENNIVKAMEQAVRKEFGNHGVSSSQTLPAVAAMPSGSNTNCLAKVMTKEGLVLLNQGNIENVMVLTGDIKKENCDVVINSSDGSSTDKTALFSGTTEKPKTEDDFVIEPLEADPACFHICSDSQAKVDSAKMWINDLIIKEESNKEIQDDAILCLSDADHKQIVDIQKNMFVSIRTVNKSGHASITIEGLNQNVLKASNVIHEMLRKAKEEEDQRRKEELASAVADWQYQAGLHFQSFDSKTNFNLEDAYGKNLTTVKITLQGRDFTVNMPGGPATDSQGRTIEIKRIDKLKDGAIPVMLDPTPAKSCHVFTIQPGSAEYNEVFTLFRASCHLNVLKIEKIQNPGLWKSLLVKKLDMEKRNGHQNNERRLFHGTSQDAVAHINEQGFNPSYAGKNGASYGIGTYFAVNACYSASNHYSKPNQKGEKFMYLCRVLTGDYTFGKHNMTTPPFKGPGSVQKYDSVVDKLAKPNMFVIFHDFQAYPEYLITFK